MIQRGTEDIVPLVQRTAAASTLAIVLIFTSCTRSDEARSSSPTARLVATQRPKPITCPPAPGGILVSFDKVAYFPSRGRMSELERLCPAVSDTLYDAIGWQAPGHAFAFVGATLVAVHSGAQPDTVPAEEPDMWTASGDSVRLADGQRLPKTLGELRALGKTYVSKNEGYDDWDGPDARNCRYPEILFKLNGDGLPKMLPDSARVTSIEINVRRRETFATYCRP